MLFDAGTALLLQCSHMSTADRLRFEAFGMGPAEISAGNLIRVLLINKRDHLGDTDA